MTLSLLGDPGDPGDLPAWSVERASWAVAALHIPFVVAAPLFVLTRHDVAAPALVAVLLAAGCLGALQLRHSFAALRGVRPDGWHWTFLGLCAVAYLPGFGYGLDWVSTTQWFVVASGAMLLTRWPAALAAIVPSIVAVVWIGHFIATTTHGSAAEVLVWMLYYLVITLVGGAALYWSTRLVRVLDQLNAARTELAELAVGRERLRVSRDLHDLLGHSLSAVSLKGDLAVRLLPSDVEAARAEIESLTGLARSTLRDMRAVARDEHAVSLSGELAAAVAVLQASGVTTQVEIELPDLSPQLEVVLAWTVREAATNILRHSDAKVCTLRAHRTGGTVLLEIVNDGAGPVIDVPAPHRAGAGHGLEGLKDRARLVSGSVQARRLPGGRFRVLVEIPDVAG